MHSITLEGHEIRYVEAGDPALPPLILIHGWLSHHGVWNQTIQALASSYHCVAVDLLGFGSSDKPDDADYSIPAQGQRIVQIAHQLGFDRFAVVGHSMGGQIALCIASMLVPECITRVVSVSGVVKNRLQPYCERIVYPQIALGAALPWGYELISRLDRYRWFAHWEHRPWFYKMDSIPFEAWAIDREMATQRSIHLSAHKAGQAMHALDLTSHLSQIVAPTLVIFGHEDGTVPVQHGYTVKQQVPSSKLVLIEHCGHFPMYEKTQAYLDALSLFMLGG
jgi:pimeloyl-ACP methyl ester carboxylesterase